MRRRAILVLSGLSLVVCASCSSARFERAEGARPEGVAPDARPQKLLRVATFNVNFGLAGDPATLAAISATGADVVLLQETNRAWQRAIEAHPELPTRYPHRRFYLTPGWPAGGMAFLSRYPLRAPKRSPSAVGWFDAHRLVAATPHGKVLLVNLHLKPPVSASGSVISGYFSTPKERRREMRGHLALFDPKLPTIVAGDFNEQRGGGLAMLGGLKFEDAIRARGGTSSSPTTWRWKVGPLTLRQQLDHILYDRRRFTCVEARVLKIGRSDHLPVVALLRLKG
jgi:endonuclease/exonuclease/phosphatase (EEP) superfamily protein YafD